MNMNRYCSYIGKECERLPKGQHDQHNQHNHFKHEELRDKVAMAWLGGVARYDTRHTDVDIEGMIRTAFRYADAYIRIKYGYTSPPNVEGVMPTVPVNPPYGGNGMPRPTPTPTFPDGNTVNRPTPPFIP